jgi:predicted AlkP superfamily pyrophosphatase or phosphodiesterase
MTQGNSTPALRRDQHHSRWLLAVLTATAFAMPSAAQPGPAAEPHRDRCVILISVDGLANFYLDDRQAEMPTLRRMAREGARTDGLLCSFPTVTWPNHTTLVTGVPPAKHGVIGNNYLDRASGREVPFIPDPLFDKDQIVKVPTIYDAAHNAGLSTAAIVWPATRSARTLDWTVPDMFGAEAWPKYGTATWLEELRAAGLPVDRHGTWTETSGGGVQRDWLYTRMARHVLHEHSPNLLLIHLVEVDHVQHRHGPRSPEAYWSVSFADDRLRDILAAVNRSPRRETTTIIVASDHGFFPIEKDIHPNVVLRELGLIETEGREIKQQRARCLAQGGASMVYILDEDQREEIAAQLQRELAKLEGVRAVLGPEEFERIGQPTPQEDARAPDLWLSSKSGYSFSNGHTAEEPVTPRASPGGTHGYLPDDPEMLGTLVLWGHGVEPGARPGRASNLDVAPTIARLLGIELPTADGKPLDVLKASP